jgi:hypothetical protein
MSVAAPRSAELADRERAHPHPALSPPRVVLLAAGLVLEMALLALWQRNAYWDFSDGVYAQSARELLHGLMPYRDFAAAQPPPVYLAGALLLAFHDGLAALRAGLALADLATAALAGLAVWRLSGRFPLALAATAAAPLLPISLHEHAQLVPETLAAPLLLAGAIWVARVPRAAAAGALLALAAACKLAFGLPALAIALASPARRRALLGLVLTGILLAALSLAVFGTALWREAVDAQLQAGHASLHYAGGLLAQGAWSELPLIAGAGAAVLLATRDPLLLREPALARTLAAAACAGLVLALTVFKRGSYIGVLAVAEPPLLCLAACGAAWAWEHSRRSRPVVAALGMLLAAQSLSLLASPADPWAAKRPGAASGLAWQAGPAAVDAAVSAARACPRTLAYSGAPYVAFLAARRMPGRQPDLFMLAHARADSAFAKRAARDNPRCP